MSGSGAAGRGAVGGASVRGFSHVSDGRPNQDAVGYDREGDWAFLAVADGHGAAPHHRSDRGARFAVESALDLLRALAPDLAGRAATGRVADIAQGLVAGWQDRVESDIRLAPPLRERPGEESLAVYGATCLAAAIGPEVALFLQIGDGDLLAASAGGPLDRAVPSDPAFVGSATYSLCQPGAEDRVRLRLFSPPHPLSRPDLVLAATDGLSRSDRCDPEFLAVARHLGDELRTRPLAAVVADLGPWLAECSRRGSRDDITVALYSGRDDERRR